MIRRVSALCAMTLCLLAATAVYAQPSLSAVEELDINWEATRQLVFLPLDSTSLDAGQHEVQVRIHEQGQPLFFEQVRFDVGTEKADFKGHAPLGLQILAYQREERAWLLERLAEGAELGVKIQIDDAFLFDGSFADLVAESDKFREGPIQPIDATPSFVDFREPLNKLCVDDCYDDYGDCQVDFCYWDYDEYMCEQGCDEELDECLAIADPVCEPPTCTPGVVTTDTDTVLISTQYVGLACMRDIFNFNNSVYYSLVNLTYQVTTRELHRNADCSTTWVTISTSTFTQSCQQYSGLACSFGFVYPSCVI